jgi:hypothetical protein
MGEVRARTSTPPARLAKPDSPAHSDNLPNSKPSETRKNRAFVLPFRYRVRQRIQRCTKDSRERRAKMHTDRLTSAERAPTQRSRATNGRSLFAQGGDMRTPWARRLRDVFALHVNDLGGPDAISEAEKSICRRAAVLTVELERLEARFATDTAAQGTLETYQRTAGALRRLLESVGLQRRAKNITPTLADLLAEDRGEAP